MSRSNRDNIAAAFRLAIYLLIAVGFLVVVWQISGVYAERRQNAEHRARQYADTTDRRVANACAAVERSAVLECVTKQVEAAREDERTEYDLQAQQDSADAAFWMAWISFATLAATLVALWFVKGTLEATREAVKDTGEATDAMREANYIAKGAADDADRYQRKALLAARKSAKIDQRAWVKFEIEARHGPVKNKGGEQRFAFRGKLINIGRTPALHVNYFALLCFDELPEEALAAEIERIKKTPYDWDGAPILPGDDYTLSFTVNVEEEERVAAGLGKGGFANGSMVFVIMVVQYRTVHDNTHHHTAGFFRLHANESPVNAIDFSRYHQEGFLALIRHRDGAGYVD